MKQYHRVIAVLCLPLAACGNPETDLEPIDIDEKISAVAPEPKSEPEKAPEETALPLTTPGNTGVEAIAAETREGTYRDMANSVTETMKDQTSETESYFEER